MTTIAANRKVMAGDRVVTDDTRFYNTPKIFVIGSNIVGVAGVVSSTNRWLTWFRSGQPPEGPTFTDDDGMEALVLNRAGLFVYTECGEPDRIDEGVYAIGTGGSAALALMRNVRWTPRKAVIGASKVDRHTGSKVLEIALSSVPA